MPNGETGNGEETGGEGNARDETVANANCIIYAYQGNPPENFSFVAGDWPKWVKRWDRYRVISKLDKQDEVTQVNNLVYMMGDRAEDIYESFKLEPTKINDYNTVRKAFEDHFVKKSNVVYERAQFNSRKQLDNETVDEFITDLHRLAAKCRYDNLEGELIRDRIVVGIRDVKLSEALQLDPDLTLEKATEKVRQSEQVKSQQLSLRSTENIDAIRVKKRWEKRKTDNGTKSTETDSAKEQVCQRCGKIHKSKHCWAKTKICNVCKRTGHLGKVCFFRKKVQEVSQGNVDEDCESSDEDCYYVNAIETGLNEPWRVEVEVEGKQVIFKVDTGADVSVMPKELFDKRFKNKILHSTRKKLFGAGKTQLKTLGYFDTTIKYRGKMAEQRVYVLEEILEALIGRPAIAELGMIAIIGNISSKTVRENYPQLFSNQVGKLSTTEYEIKLVDNAKPYAVSAPRRVALPLRDKLKAELEKMVKQGIISPITEATEWCAAVVIVAKKNNEIRICSDYTNLNKYVIRERLVLPTVEETLGKLRGAKVFSKLDAKSGFWHIKLSNNSAKLTTFTTPFGRYYYNRMPFGISSGPEVFHRHIAQVLDNLDGVINHMDDILVFGKDEAEHDANLKIVCDKLTKAGLTLNASKCLFRVDEVKFLGYKVNREGVGIDEAKLEAITNMPSPNNQTELRRFMGMYNYLVKFVKNLSEENKPLRELLKKDIEFAWNEVHERTFQRLKQLLIKSPILVHYNYQQVSRVSADASSFGLGATLEQQQADGNWRPVCYISRSLTETERAYAQVEKEALAVVWACERLEQYLTGTKFLINTDHLPLIKIFTKSCLTELSGRLQRFRLRMMRFCYEITHVPGKSFYVPDTLSRSPVGVATTEERKREPYVENQVNVIIESAPIADIRVKKLLEEQNKDELCKKIKIRIQEGWTDKNYENDLNVFIPFKNDLSIAKTGLILKGSRILVPKISRPEMLNRLHDGHLGIVKTKRLARETIWWPGITKDIEERIQRCKDCELQRKNPIETLKQTELPSLPWKLVGADIFEFEKKLYLVVQDYFSRYIEYAHLKNITSKEVINVFKEIFARHGICQTLRCDNGKQFVSQEFQDFAKTYGFEVITSSPYISRSNGQAERAVSIIKSILKKPNPDLGLLNFRSTPLASGWSPAELLMGRKLRTTVPTSEKELIPKIPNYKTLREKEKEIKQKEEENYNRRHRTRDLDVLQPGTQVWVTDKEAFYKIVRHAKEPRSYWIQNEGKEIRRNREYLKNLDKTIEVKQPQTGSGNNEQNTDATRNDNIPKQRQSRSQMLRKSERPKREIKKPRRYRD